MTERYTDSWSIGVGSLPAFIDVGRGWEPTEVTQWKVKLVFPSTVGERTRPLTSMYPEWETFSFSYLSRIGGADMTCPKCDLADTECSICHRAGFAEVEIHKARSHSEEERLGDMRHHFLHAHGGLPIPNTLRSLRVRHRLEHAGG